MCGLHTISLMSGATARVCAVGPHAPTGAALTTTAYAA